MWVSNQSKEYDILNPVLDITLWVTMIPITENNTTGIMLGLYNNLLGKKIYYESDLIWLDKCIDQDRDGIDDITNETALTYGNSTDQYFNTALMIKFKILDIEKAPDYQEFAFEKEKASEFIFYMFQVIFTIAMPIFLIYVPIFITLIINTLNRHPINIRKVVKFLFKYVLLAGILISISYIIFGVIRTRYTLWVRAIDLLEIT